MDYYQYRVTVNGTQGPIEAYPGEKWTRIGDMIEERGGKATLERRFVTDKTFLEFKPDNVIVLGEKVITRWSIVAELEF